MIFIILYINYIYLFNYFKFNKNLNNLIKNNFN